MFRRSVVVVLIFVGGCLWAEDGELSEYNPARGVNVQDIQTYIHDQEGDTLNDSYQNDPNITPEEYDIILQFKEYGHIQRSPALPVVSRKDGKPVAVKSLPKQQGVPARKKGLSFSDMAEHIKKKEAE